MWFQKLWIWLSDLPELTTTRVNYEDELFELQTETQIGPEHDLQDGHESEPENEDEIEIYIQVEKGDFKMFGVCAVCDQS